MRHLSPGCTFAVLTAVPACISFPSVYFITSVSSTHEGRPVSHSRIPNTVLFAPVRKKMKCKMSIFQLPLNIWTPSFSMNEFILNLRNYLEGDSNSYLPSAGVMSAHSGMRSISENSCVINCLYKKKVYEFSMSYRTRWGCAPQDSSFCLSCLQPPGLEERTSMAQLKLSTCLPKDCCGSKHLWGLPCPLLLVKNSQSNQGTKPYERIKLCNRV